MDCHVFPPSGWAPAGTVNSTDEGREVPFYHAINTTPAQLWPSNISVQEEPAHWGKSPPKGHLDVPMGQSWQET